MNLVLPILAIPALIWGLILAVRGSLISGCAAYLITACCFSADYWSFDAAGLTWSLDRFLLLFLVGAYIIQWRLGQTETKPRSWGDLLLVCFVLLLFASTFTHHWHALAGEEDSILMHLVNGYLIPLVIFWIARNARLESRDLKTAYALFAVFGVYLAATALAETSGQWSLVFPRYISNPELGIHFGRARGPMLQSARLGTYLILCLAATVGWFASKGKWSRPGIILALLLAPLYLAAIYVTYTRSVWMGTASALLVTLGFVVSTRWRVALLATTLLFAVLLVAVKGQGLIAFERETGAAETRKSTYMRASFTYVSWLMFKEKPLQGFGFGQFPRESKYYLGDRDTTLQLEHIRGYIHHNTLLSLLVELGVFGLLLYLACVCYWLCCGFQLWMAPAPFWARGHGLLFLAMFSAFSFQLLFREISYSPIEHGLLFFLAGTTCSLHARFATSPCGSARPGSHWQASRQQVPVPF